MRLALLVLATLLGSACTAVVVRGAGEPAQHPLRAVGTLPAYAQPTPVATSVPVRITPASEQRDIIRDTRTEAERVVEAVHDNDGRAWLTRDRTAVWTRTPDGLVLERLAGGSLERVEGARDVRETPDGSTRALLIGDAWTLEAGGRTVRLTGAQFPSFSSDGRYLAYERSDARVRSIFVLDTQTGEEIRAVPGIGRCHCTTVDAYGFPRWATTTALFTFADPGPFDAPPEERDRFFSNPQFVYDLSTRRATRAQTSASALRAGCEQRTSLTSADGAYELGTTRSCRLPRP